MRTKTKPEAERVGKYMLRPILALERLFFLKVIAFITDYAVVDRIINHL